MSEDYLDAGTGKRTAFFRRIDWASFWTATVISFVVYFLTLSPSVSLEDSGELAVAGDHLGVPHPPGYPIWTMISYVFARAFSFVTFRGQPTPAWSIALASAVFGALAAGCTAMLITRSSSDLLRNADESVREDNPSRDNLISWVCGVAGSLIFAFSPVMWSQSTIVEVYALGAFFLMMVMLLTYRWMRQPSDKLLWLTAFVFGLGLTNYQVLLLAALPLVVIIFLRNVALFRDFLLVVIPFGVGGLLLKIGAELSQPGLPKLPPLTGKLAIPNNTLCVISLVVFALSVIGLLVWLARRRSDGAASGPVRDKAALFAGAGLGFAVLAMLLAGGMTRTAAFTNPQDIVLVPPARYVFIAAILLASAGLNVFAAAFDDEGWKGRLRVWTVSVSAGLAVLALLVVAGCESARPIPTAGLRPDQIYPFGMYSKLIVAALVVFVALAATTPKGIYFAMPLASMELAVLALASKGAFMGLTHPSTWWFWAPVAFNFLILGLAALALPNGRSVAMTAICAELGVSFYIYMPIVSDLRNPPMNWGYPRTWEGFKHAIMRGQYEAIKPTSIFAPKFMKQIGSYFTDLRTQFTLLIAPFGFLPFTAWKTGATGKAKRNAYLVFGAALALAFGLWGIDGWVEAEAISDAAGGFLRGLSVLLLVAAIGYGVWARIAPLSIAAVFMVIALAFVVIGEIPGVEQIVDLTRIDKLAIAGLILTGAVGGTMLAYRKFDDSVEEMLKSDDLSKKVTVGLVVLGLVAIAVGFVFKTLQAILAYRAALRLYGDAETVFTSWDKISPALLSEPSIMTVSALGALLLVGGAIFGLHILHRRRAVEMTIDNVTQEWLIGTFCNFFVMSFVLIVLANPKGDLQDSFIQKVKFIASHGLFALLIGYGFVFALVTVRNALRPLVSIAALAILCTSLIPIYENYFNDRLVFELGGAEQNGHDYGWQFGNYQLRGADAITEELEPDEEPLPNPSYPPAMAENAVFFGGTDPGRFVPTYMIYSADVRPDVFLITQNALADNTFMSVTRDLYGDANRKAGERPGLWIPTPDDSAEAFRIYVDEVQSGKRPNNADLKIDNGRVQVVGALGVMEINGILCDMIFKRNKQWHEFYVEESYVIPWMYPYLTPHGLIMHINAERYPITQTNTNDDLDFWDWYVRRITRDRKYRRDIVAQKSFSKLRSAIAGLYMARGRLSDAERAYLEARILYPVSPEANFRMIQDVFLRQGRFEEALEYLDYFCAKDPNHERGPALRKFISDTMALQNRVSALVAQHPSPAQTPTDDAVEIATIYRELGQVDRALSYVRAQKTLARKAGQIYSLCQLAHECGDARLAAEYMDKISSMALVTKSSERLRLAYRIYGVAGDYAKMSRFLDSYLAREAKDLDAWIDCATLSLAIGDTQKATSAIIRALAIDRVKASSKIEASPELMRFAEQTLSRRRTDQPATLPGF